MTQLKVNRLIMIRNFLMLNNSHCHRGINKKPPWGSLHYWTVMLSMLVASSWMFAQMIYAGLFYIFSFIVKFN